MGVKLAQECIILLLYVTTADHLLKSSRIEGDSLILSSNKKKDFVSKRLRSVTAEEVESTKAEDTPFQSAVDNLLAKLCSVSQFLSLVESRCNMNNKPPGHNH